MAVLQRYGGVVIMCGRFNIAQTPGLAALFKSLGITIDLPPARYNIAPTDPVPLLREDSLDDARWWLTPSWAVAIDQKYSMFNARAETLASSRAFAKPFRSQRGIVPMSSFIEWRTESGSKQPWRISNAEHALAVAALWDVWYGGDEPLLSCALVTTAAADAFRPWHSRMPVLLTVSEGKRWLDNSQPIAADDTLLQPRLKCRLELAPLPAAVGNARNKSGSLMHPVGEPVHLDSQWS